MSLYLQALPVKSKEDLALCSAHRAVCQGSVWCGKLSPGLLKAPAGRSHGKVNCASLGHVGSRVPAAATSTCPPHQPPPHHRFPEKGNSSLWLSPSHGINVPLGQGDGFSLSMQGDLA